VIWSDDPEGMLFDSNETENDNWSLGIQYGLTFKHYKGLATDGQFFASGAPLLARSHLGDLQVLHAMAPKSGEAASATQGQILEWCEFLYGVAIGRVAETWPLSTISLGRMEDWFQGSAMTVKQLFLVGSKGSVPQRSLGALLHIIQDSFAAGHVERLPDGKVQEFHCYVGQDSSAHNAADVLHPDGIDRMPGAIKAVQACEKVLNLWKSARPWEILRAYLKDEVFALSSNPNPSSPGREFSPSPGAMATTGPRELTCSYNASGVVFNQPTSNASSQHPYSWGSVIALFPGMAPISIRHRKATGDTGEIRCLMFLSMDAEHHLVVAGEVSLYSDIKGSKHLQDARSFALLPIPRGKALETLLEIRVGKRPEEGASFRLGVSNEGD
jgi:hypothetical protein